MTGRLNRPLLCRDCGHPHGKTAHALYCGACARLRRNGVTRRYLNRRPEKRRQFARQANDRIRSDPELMERERARARRLHAADPIKFRDRSIRSRHNMTRAEFDAMLVVQGGQCALCRLPVPTDRDEQFARHEPQVDHNRECCPGAQSCGRCIRGLLCRVCNTRLGAIEKPTAEWWDRAREYMRAGHQSLETTRGYKGRTPKALGAAAEKMHEAMG